VHCWVLREHAQSTLRAWPVGRVVGVDDVVVLLPRLIWSHTVIPCVGLVWWGRVGWVLGWLFENCTVDASIFVVKLLRAHGGCLGIRSR
jgi:hypothetical protein